MSTPAHTPDLGSAAYAIMQARLADRRARMAKGETHLPQPSWHDCLEQARADAARPQPTQDNAAPARPAK